MNDSGEPRWLLLLHQIPPHPGSLRVKIWRRLQRLGAVAIKNSVYVLPRGDSTAEDFEWTLREIVAGGGDGSICEARFVQGLDDEQIVDLFNAARDADFTQITSEVRLLLDEFPERVVAEQRSRVETEILRLRRRFAETVAIDFFAAPGQQVCAGVLASLGARLQDPAAERPAGRRRGMDRLRGRTWVTRAGIHVDRMASAWLIRRWIDPDATFEFVAAKSYRPKAEEIRFDMFEAEYTHEGDHCTFEVLVERFELEDPALQAIAAIVHDVDLKDERFGSPETPGVEHLLGGITRATADDTVRLARATVIFEGLYDYFSRRPS